MASKKKHSVLFICLGNICRSPIAEAVFLRLIAEKGVQQDWDVDSAALGTWHIDGPPDDRTMATLEKKQITNYVHKARQVCSADYTRFDYIFGMDEANMSELEDRQPSKSTTKLVMLGEFDPQKELVIRDPYFDNHRDTSGFDKVYEQCVRCCQAFYDAKTSGSA